MFKILIVLSVSFTIVVQGTKHKPIIFPEDEKLSQEIPESLLIQMGEITTLAQFLSFLGPSSSTTDPKEKPYGIGKDGRPVQPEGSGNEEDKNATTLWSKKKGLSSNTFNISPFGGCAVEMQSVELDNPEDPSLIFYPKCVRIPRCGGCCPGTQLECVATKTSPMEVTVLQARYQGINSNNPLVPIGNKKFTLEKHEKCKCRCKEKEEDCSENQKYLKQECKCVCVNKADREACTGSQHFWDSKACQCKCKNEQECSTGHFFNYTTCRCYVPVQSRIGRPLFFKRPAVGGAVVSKDDGGESGAPKEPLGIRPGDVLGIRGQA